MVELKFKAAQKKSSFLPNEDKICVFFNVSKSTSSASRVCTLTLYNIPISNFPSALHIYTPLYTILRSKQIRSVTVMIVFNVTNVYYFFRIKRPMCHGQVCYMSEFIHTDQDMGKKGGEFGCESGTFHYH
jgi:hypothetical protein